MLSTRLTTRCCRVLSARGFSSRSGLPAAKRRRAEDEIHRPSLSGSSVGHLIAEISAMRPGMEALRPDGQTMTEEQRAFARKTVTWLMGLPLAVGVAFVGGKYFLGDDERDAE